MNKGIGGLRDQGIEEFKIGIYPSVIPKLAIPQFAIIPCFYLLPL